MQHATNHHYPFTEIKCVLHFIKLFSNTVLQKLKEKTFISLMGKAHERLTGNCLANTVNIKHN